jgi:hypothetical protein
MATTVNPDPDANGVLDSIRLRGDWNPPDGVAGQYEDVTFSRAGNTIFVREPVDPTAVPIADNIATMTFVYRDRHYVLIADPIASFANIASTKSRRPRSRFATVGRDDHVMFSAAARAQQNQHRRPHPMSDAIARNIE